MRLTDYCMLYAALFVCLFLGRDLSIAGLAGQSCTQAVYNRQMDRIAEDALMDVVETQLDDGTPSVRMNQMRTQYERLLRLNFDLTDDDCTLRAWEAVTLWQVGHYPYAFTAEELESLRDGMERQVNDIKRRRREQTRLAIEFPYIAVDDWYQMPSGTQLMTVFDPLESLHGIDRAVFSGSRIVKKSIQNSVVE